MASSQLEKAIGWLLHKRRHIDPDSLFQARLTAAVIFIAMVTAFATGIPLILILGDPSGYVTFCFGLSMLTLLFIFKYGLSHSTSFVLLELATGIHFLLCRSLQDRIDWPLAMWLTVFPILRLLYGGFRHGLLGIVYTTILAIFMYAMEFGSPFPQVPVSEIISFERGVSFTIAIFIITAVFNELRIEAIGHADKAAKARTLFLANMSHELRTPMNGVIGITELLLGSPLSDEIRKQLELVHRSGKQMIALINDILDLTRLESSKLSLEIVPTDLRTILQDVRALQEPSVKEKDLIFHLEIDENIPTSCMMDAMRLKQILTNLAGNAVKFTEKGSVTLKASLLKDKIQFQVIDTGIGIPKQVQKKLFVPFEQADVSFTRRYGGSGLGLAISQRLVLLLGGILQVKSEEGCGSSFFFDIECHPNPEILSTSPLPPPQNKKDIHLRVLVVEDNEVNLVVALGMLKRSGCMADSRTNGKEAVEAVKIGDYDLVLMDCHMPVMDGFEATRLIRKLEDHSKIPIIALTASAMKEDLQACFDSGMDGVLTKPLSLPELREKLQQIQGAVKV